jgi:hypothetical protein
MLTVRESRSVPVKDTDVAARDSHPWSSSIVFGVAFVVFGMAFSLLYFPISAGTSAWQVPTDTWMAVDAGRYIWNGAFGYVYQGTSAYALPLSFILLAPIAGAIDHFGWVEGAPFPVPHPTAWLLVAPFTLLFGIFALHAIRRLAWDLGVRNKLWAVQLAAVIVVLAPCYLWGHFEDVIAVTFVMYALRRLISHEHLRAAVLLSIAISAKQWALPLVPVVVFTAPGGQRLRTAAVACALPATLVAFVLAADWTDASRALFSPVNMGRITQGHLSFYATWLGSKTSQASRTLGLGIASFVAWHFRRLSRPTTVIAAVALIVGLRPFFEAISYSYYWAPGLALAGCTGLAAHRIFRIRDWVWPVAAVIWAMPRANSATGSWWWAGEVVIISAVAVRVAMNCNLVDGCSAEIRTRVIDAGVSLPMIRAISRQEDFAKADKERR